MKRGAWKDCKVSRKGYGPGLHLSRAGRMLVMSRWLDCVLFERFCAKDKQ